MPFQHQPHTHCVPTSDFNIIRFSVMYFKFVVIVFMYLWCNLVAICNLLLMNYIFYV